MQPVILVTIDVRRERLAEFLALAYYHAQQSRLEPGCLRFDVLRDLQHPSRFTLHEIYQDGLAVEAHRKTPHYARWKGEISLYEEAPRQHANCEVIDPGATVFTNGCFDVLHAGHVAMLREARAQGGRLVVAVNSDASVRRLKGPARPLQPLADRMTVLSALSCVSEVVSFDTETELLGLIYQRQPDVLAKGGDYTAEEVVGGRWVESYSGRVHLTQHLAGISTTRLLERLS